MNIIKIIQSDGKNKGYCRKCEEYFKKNDYIIVFDKCKINHITQVKICAECYIKELADKIGWANINALILKWNEKKI